VAKRQRGVRKPICKRKERGLMNTDKVLLNGRLHQVVFMRRAKACGKAPWLVIVRDKTETAVTADKVKLVREKKKAAN
jgi:hypothetical protein